MSNYGSESQIMEVRVKIMEIGSTRQITIIAGGSYQNCVACINFKREGCHCLTPFVVLRLP